MLDPGTQACEAVRPVGAIRTGRRLPSSGLADLRFMAMTHDEDSQGLAEYALILLGGNVSKNLMLIGTSI